MYKRALLKLSGEQLRGNYDGGFDAELAKWIAGQVKQAVEGGTQIVIMVGGGNYARGAQLAGHGITRVTADNIGMIATLMNALALSDIFNDQGVDTRAVSTVKADQVVDQFTHRRVLSHLQKHRVVIVAGGLARPYLTTDTGAVSLALEMGCDVILKATKVDGVYDSDPAQNPTAQKFEQLTYQQSLEDNKIKVMDKAALGLAMEQGQKLIVFDLLTDGNVAKACRGESIGTTIS